MNNVTKQTLIGEVLDWNQDTSKYFLQMGMHCLGCPSSRNETIEQACQVHGVNADNLVAQLNEFLSNQQ